MEISGQGFWLFEIQFFNAGKDVASFEAMEEILGVEKGAVSPFSLYKSNEQINEIKIFVDSDVFQSELLCFPPNINTETIQMTKEEFQKTLDKLGNEYEIIDI